MTVLSIGKSPRKPGDVVDALLDCHVKIRGFVELARSAATRAGAADAEVAEACAQVERYFTVALPLHVEDEETSLLPRLRGRDAQVDQALAEMHAQHEAHVPKLRTFLEATAATRAAPSDPGRRAALAGAAADIGRELAVHLELEETVLFPAIRRLVPPAERSAIADEIRARRTPVPPATAASPRR